MPEVSSVERIPESLPERYDPEKYTARRSLYPEYVHSPEEIRERINAFPDKRISVLSTNSDNSLSVYLIDSAIRIRSVAEAYRKQQRAFWEKIYNGHLLHGNVAALGTVVSLLGGFFAKKSVFMPVVVITFAAMALYAGYQWGSARNAAAEVKAWDHSPVLHAAKFRERAYDRGFSYAYAQQLKLQPEAGFYGVLHPQEIKTLYDQYFPTFCQKMASKEVNTDQDRLIWLVDLTKTNPILPSVMNYALGEIPAHLKPVSEEMEQFVTKIKKWLDESPTPEQVLSNCTEARQLLQKAEQAWKN